MGQEPPVSQQRKPPGEIYASHRQTLVLALLPALAHAAEPKPVLVLPATAHSAHTQYGRAAFYQELHAAGFEPVSITRSAPVDADCPEHSVSEWKGVAVRLDSGYVRQSVLVCRDAIGDAPVAAYVDERNQPVVVR